jgi:hypothetical protein
MVTAPLIAPTDIEEFPGAPFPQPVVEAACGAVRGAAGWHIAPVATEAFTLDCDGGTLLVLPVREVTEVTEVRDVRDPDNPVVLTGWRKTRAGMVYRGAGWPEGFETVEVDVTCGLDDCPAELLPVIVEHCQLSMTSTGVQQESSGSESVTYRGAGGSGSVVMRDDPRVARYALGPRV